MSERVDLENALLKVETAARGVLDEALKDDELEVPATLAFAMIEMRDTLTKLDSVRSAIRARQKLEAGAGL